MYSLCVYCGSRGGDRPAFAAAARALGDLIGRSGHQLVYGGGCVGLMGVVADAALAAGGHVLGVIPHALMAREVGHRGLTELRVVPTMHERKQQMAAAAHAFVALPGGIGTLEELFEMWSWQVLGYHAKPVAVLNVEGYFDPLLAFLADARSRGFVSAAQHDALIVDDDVSRVYRRLQHAAADAAAVDDDSRP